MGPLFGLMIIALVLTLVVWVFSLIPGEIFAWVFGIVIVVAILGGIRAWFEDKNASQQAKIREREKAKANAKLDGVYVPTKLERIEKRLGIGPKR